MANVGQTQSIVVDPANPRVAFAVTAIAPSGLKTVDGGTHWREVSPSGSVSIASLAYDPRNPRVVYAGGDDGCGVLRSENGGTSWQKAGLNGCGTYKKNQTGETVSALAFSPNGQVLYAGTTYGFPSYYPAIFRSTNGGQSWRRVSDSPGGDVPLLVLDPENPRTLYTSTQGVFRSTDGGAKWKTLPVPGAVDAMAIDPRHPQNVYAGAGFSGGVLKSTDGGASWRIAGLDGDDVEALALDPRNPRTIYAGTLGGVFRSPDGGRRWSPFRLSGKNVWSLGIASNGRILYAGTDNAVVTFRVGR